MHKVERYCSLIPVFISGQNSQVTPQAESLGPIETQENFMKL